MKRTISLVTFVKNEENCIAHMLESVIDYVDEIILVDTGCTDNTIKIALETCMHEWYDDRDMKTKYSSKLKLFSHEFKNFGETRTWAAQQATMDWVLMLDADETLSDPQMLQNVINQGSKAYAFPRRRWLDLEMKNQTELEAYPDLQVRLFQNHQGYLYRRELHEYFDGTAVMHFIAGPIIEHFQDVFKSEQRKAERQALYEKLAPLAGVTVDGGHVI